MWTRLRRTALIFATIASLTIAPVRAQTLRVAVQQEPRTLNPVLSTQGIEDDAFNLIFDGLVRVDDAGALVPDLATRVPTLQNGDIARDGKTVTYHLVRTATWHDGAPVTSDDVKFTYEAIVAPRNDVVSRSPYDRFERVDTPDPYTVVVRLKTPYAPVIATSFTASGPGVIVPAHILRGVTDFNRNAFAMRPVGSGPFKVVMWKHGQDLSFAANRAYFRGSPKIARIVWRFYPNENTILALLRAHDVDLVDGLGVATYALLAGAPGLISELASSLEWEHLTFNTARGPLEDVLVRRALCEAMDVDEIYAKVYHRAGDRGVGFQHPRTPWYDSKLTSCRYDPDHARALLERAGWHAGPAGLRTRGGRPLEIVFSTVAGIVDREQAQVLLQSRWREVGVETHIKNYPPSLFFAPTSMGGIVSGGRFDVALSSYAFSNDPNRAMFDTSSRVAPLQENQAFWHDALVATLEDRGSRTFDPNERKRAYDRIQRIVAKELPYVTMRWSRSIAVHDRRLHGLRPAFGGSNYWNAREWTI